MNAYRAPFRAAGEDRPPTLTWPRELPIEGEPRDVTGIVESYGTWLSASEVPKLFVNADPGAILTGTQRQWVRTWPSQHEVTVPGKHYLQEDSAHAIGKAIADWHTRCHRSRGAVARGPAGARAPGAVRRAGFPDGPQLPCATRRTGVSPAQRARTGGGVCGSDGLPGSVR